MYCICEINRKRSGSGHGCRSCDERLGISAGFIVSSIWCGSWPFASQTLMTQIRSNVITAKSHPYNHALLYYTKISSNDMCFDHSSVFSSSQWDRENNQRDGYGNLGEARRNPREWVQSRDRHSWHGERSTRSRTNTARKVKRARGSHHYPRGRGTPRSQNRAGSPFDYNRNRKSEESNNNKRWTESLR